MTRRTDAFARRPVCIAAQSQIVMVVLGSLGRQHPMLNVWAIVFVVAPINWSKYPRASTLTIVAVLISLGANLLGNIAFPLLPQMIETMDISWLLFGVSICLSLLHVPIRSVNSVVETVCRPLFGCGYRRQR